MVIVSWVVKRCLFPLFTKGEDRHHGGPQGSAALFFWGGVMETKETKETKEQKETERRRGAGISERGFGIRAKACAEGARTAQRAGLRLVVGWWQVRILGPSARQCWMKPLASMMKQRMGVSV